MESVCQLGLHTDLQRRIIPCVACRRDVWYRYIQNRMHWDGLGAKRASDTLGVLSEVSPPTDCHIATHLRKCWIYPSREGNRKVPIPGAIPCHSTICHSWNLKASPRIMGRCSRRNLNKGLETQAAVCPLPIRIDLKWFLRTYQVIVPSTISHDHLKL